MNKPAMKWKEGPITLTMWTNKNTVGEFSSFNIQRSYKDKDQKWANTNSIRQSDFQAVIKLLNTAQDHLNKQAAKQVQKKEA